MPLATIQIISFCGQLRVQNSNCSKPFFRPDANPPNLVPIEEWKYFFELRLSFVICVGSGNFEISFPTLCQGFPSQNSSNILISLSVTIAELPVAAAVGEVVNVSCSVAYSS